MSKARAGLVVPVLVVVLVAGLLGGRAVHAELVVDQQLTELGDPPASYYIGGTSEQTLAQTFRSELGGWIGAVELPVQCPPWSTEGFVTAELRTVDAVTGAPGDLVLGAVTISGSALRGDPGTWRSFPISGVRLDAGTDYSIVLGGDPLRNCYLTSAPFADSYPHGAGWARFLPHSPEWSLVSDTDFPFRVLVDDGTDPDDGYCRFRDASGTPPGWVPPRHAPVCRCLRDETLRAQRCWFELPGLVVMRELPWTGEGPIDALWSVIPLADAAPEVVVSLSSPAGTLEGDPVEFRAGGKPFKPQLERATYWIGGAALDHVRVEIHVGDGAVVFEDRKPQD